MSIAPGCVNIYRRHAGELPSVPGHIEKNMIRRRLLLLIAFAFAAAVMADDPPPAAAPAPLHIESPDYPASARRFNVTGVVVARVHIEPDGHISRTVILRTPADVLSEAVLKAVSRWQYAPTAEPADGVTRVPFDLAEGEYAFSTDIRPLLASAPIRASDLDVRWREGWSHVRLLIDATGAVTGKLVLKSSGAQFAATQDAILSTLRFSSAPQGATEDKATTVNLFFIHVLPGGEIRFNQLSGV